MNYHSDKWIRNRVSEHSVETNKIVGPFGNNYGSICACALYGSQNYGLDSEHSDVDTRAVIIPNLHTIALGKSMLSTTHVCSNDEHIDLKDVRLYVDNLRKQNLTYIETLFTSYVMINELYKKDWEILSKNREMIARLNPIKAVKTMQGLAYRKYKDLEHPYPTKMDLINTYGYDQKQLLHLARIGNYLKRYINGISVEECLKPSNIDYLMKIKSYAYSLDEARDQANTLIKYIDTISDEFVSTHENKNDEYANELLNDFLYRVIEKGIKKELED